MPTTFLIPSQLAQLEDFIHTSGDDGTDPTKVCLPHAHHVPDPFAARGLHSRIIYKAQDTAHKRTTGGGETNSHQRQ
jgi:hypothetical protein